MLLLWLAFELMMESLPITPAEPPSTVNPAVTVEIPAPSTSVAVTAPAVAAEAEVDVVTRDATVAYILRTGEAFIMSKSSFHVCNPKEISNVDFVLSDNVEVSQDGNFLTVLAISGDSHAAGAQHTISEFSKRVIEMGDDGFSLFLPPPSIEEVAAMVGTDPNSEAMQFKYDVVGGNVRAHMWTLWKHYDVVSDSFTEDNAVAGETVRDALACVFGAQYCNPQNTDKFNLASWAYYLITPWLVSKRVDSSLFREIPTKTSFTPEREVFVTVFMGILADMLQRDLDDLHCKQR